MNFILDTSAIIGLVERQNPHVGEALRADGNTELPMCHVVSLGELAGGVHAARVRGDESAVAQREQTLSTARSLADPDDPLGRSEIECFGIITALTSRKLSHNDQWILACAAAEQAQLVTEDQRQADESADGDLRMAVMDRLGLVLRPAVFVGA